MATESTFSGTDQIFLSMILLGRFDTDQPFGENIPFQSSLINTVRVKSMNATLGGTGTPIALTGKVGGCAFDTDTKVYWIHRNGTLEEVGAGDTTSATFTVPEVSSAGFYGIMWTDGTKRAYVTFEHNGT